MADHPEELNWIRRGEHYGFPYVFGDGEAPAYADGPKAPEGREVRRRRSRTSARRASSAINPLYSLAPHSAPGGMVFYRTGKLPRRFENSFFLARFGNLVNYNRIGFDVLNIRLEEPKGAGWSPTPSASSTAWAGRSTSASATASCTSSSTAARARPSGRRARATRPADACSKSPRARDEWRVGE